MDYANYEGRYHGERMNNESPKLTNYKKRQEVAKPETALSRYEKEVDEYKKLLNDKIHPDNHTAAYETNIKSVFNRLLVAADGLEGENPGEGVFGLIILALRANLALKDRNVELEVQIRELERKVKRLEQR